MALPAPAAAAAGAPVGGGGVGEGLLRVPRRAVAEGDGPARGAQRRGPRRPRRALGRLGRRRGADGGEEALLGGDQRRWCRPAAAGPGHVHRRAVVEDGGGGGAVDDPALEAEYEAAVRDMECAREESARLRAAMLRDDFVPVPTGWVA
ncbi:unnamed protein product [Urochloa humidicola]